MNLCWFIIFLLVTDQNGGYWSLGRLWQFFIFISFRLGGGREVQKIGDRCIPMANLCWYMAETNTIIYSDYPPIKNKQIKSQKIYQKLTEEFSYITRYKNTQKSIILLGITSHQSEWSSSPNLQTMNAAEGVEKREPSYTVCGNVNWYSHCGEQ